MHLDLEPISASQAWIPGADTLRSFAFGYRPCRVHGPARLVRLLSHAGQAPEGPFYRENREDGSFWMAESDFDRLRRAAEADLRAQEVSGRHQAQRRLGMYLRMQLRDVLAIRRDWTPSFDYRVVLAIPPRAAVVALVGRIREQPVYSPGEDGAEGATKAGIVLPGGLTQYVIDFAFSANRSALRYLENPVAL